MQSCIAGMLIMSAFLFAATGVRAQSTYYVNASRPDDSGDGLTWGTAKRTIQAAVDIAVNAGDIVLVTNGVYNAGGAVTPGYALVNRVCITNAITVQSVNGPEVTIIEGAPGSNGSNDVDSIRGVFMSGGCSLIGFTVTNGYTMASGDFWYDRCGGGVWMAANCVASNLIVSGNFTTSDDNGGGLYLYQGGELNNSTVSGNSAGFGGGVYLYQDATVNNSTVSGNSAVWCGGGVFVDDGGTVNNSILIGNNSPDGGGAFLWKGGKLNNSAVSGNTGQWGGGVALQGGTLNNCTLSGNTASDDGGGVYFFTSYTVDSNVVNNCILWGNTADVSGNDIFGDATSLIYSSTLTLSH